MSGFHEVLFPLDIALGARGGPERRTEIVALGSNREARNARWARSRRRWEAGYGVKAFADLAVIVDFFEERRGRLYGFRWRDRFDHSSGRPGAAHAPYQREIPKPVAGSVRVAVAGVELAAAAFAVDATTGVVTLTTAPATGASVTAGFLFDTPARFDTDFLEIDHSGFEAGEAPKIPIVEILP